MTDANRQTVTQVLPMYGPETESASFVLQAGHLDSHTARQMDIDKMPIRLCRDDSFRGISKVAGQSKG
jgi:hypothetical protein